MAHGNAVKHTVAEVAKTFGASIGNCCLVELAETLGEFRYVKPLRGDRPR